jgi:hypothetical protein
MKYGLATGLSIAAFGLGTRALLKTSTGSTGEHPHFLPTPSPSRPFPAEGDDATAEVSRAFLMYFVVPLWIAAGTADAACHRASEIETTSGPKESALHILMLAEVGIPLMAAMFLEVTSPVLALLIASFILHELTSLWDVSYAVKRREVTPIEQHVHSFLEMIPLMAASVTAILHWKQFLSLTGIRRDPQDFRIMLKKRPLPIAYSATVIASAILFEGLPYIHEFIRGVRATPLRQLHQRAGVAPAATTRRGEAS